MSINSKMTALADEIRELSGTTASKSIDAMTSDVNAANAEIAEQAELLSQIATALEGKASDSGGVILPTLTNPASTSDILSGKEAIDSAGNKITGTIATKTSSNLTASGATVTVPAGYYATNVTKSVATATQATPSVSINSSGLITASATQTAGYVSAGTKSGTKQLTTQAAKTVTPSTSSQTAVASGRYTTGAVTVKGDSNIVAENIKSGTSIFGVTGTYEGSGGGGTTLSTSNITLNYSSNSMMMILGVYYSKLGTEGIEHVACETFDDYVNFSLTLDNVVCNTNIVILFEETIASIEVSDNVVEVNLSAGIRMFRVTDTNNGLITINN